MWMEEEVGEVQWGYCIFNRLRYSRWRKIMNEMIYTYKLSQWTELRSGIVFAYPYSEVTCRYFMFLFHMSREIGTGKGPFRFGHLQGWKPSKKTYIIEYSQFYRVNHIKITSKDLYFTAEYIQWSKEYQKVYKQGLSTRSVYLAHTS